MRQRRQSSSVETAPAAATQDRLGGVRVVRLDDDERPSREDLTYGETIFNRGVVPLPRFLTGRKKPPQR